MEFSRCAPDAPAVLAKTARCLEGGLSKLSSMVDVEVDVLPGEPGHRTA
jgi:hypothetical protein